MRKRSDPPRPRCPIVPTGSGHGPRGPGSPREGEPTIPLTVNLDDRLRTPPPASIGFGPGGAGGADLVGAGSWTVANAASLDRQVDASLPGRSGVFASIDVGAVVQLDVFGACVLERLVQASAGGLAAVTGLDEARIALMRSVRPAPSSRPSVEGSRSSLAIPEAVGRALVERGRDLVPLLTLLGALVVASWRVATGSRRFRFTSLVHHLDRVALKAVPIIVLITTLVGAIIAQQGIFNFRKFGAESFVVDLVGILVLRELGVLIVAIMVAGRSGSSYTAELGSMRMREEVDALVTMGLDPVEVLVLPRVLALVLAMPILTFVGTVSALAGGGLVSWLYAGMSPATYVARLNDAVSITHFEVGMIKAPLMAVVIGIVACAEGLRVEGSAESLGLRTTASVVKSIFLVILLDSLCAMVFAAVGM